MMKLRLESVLAGTLLWIVSNVAALADDWPQWHGLNRDGVSRETGWLAKWPKGGPKVLWKTSVGTGYSSMSVSGERLYTLGDIKRDAGEGRKERFDIIWCLDAASGKEIWKYSYPCNPGKRVPYPWPHSTPTVDGEVIYTLGRMGHLFCLKAASGEVIWSKHLVDDLKGKRPYYGYACSPLVVGKLLIVVEVGDPDAAAIAFNKKTGEVAWKFSHERPSEKRFQTLTNGRWYSSPVAYGAKGQECVVLLVRPAVVGVEAKTGREIWRYPWPPEYAIATPIVSGDRVFISATEGKGSAVLIKIGPGGASLVWQNQEITNYFQSCVLVGGHLYGTHNPNHTYTGKKAILRCVEFDTGQVKWEQKGFGNASLIAADDKLIIMSEKGELVIVEAAPEDYREIARTTVFKGSRYCWILPVLCGGRIYCRNRSGALVCLDVKGK